jgi:flagellar biosynthesis protein FlhB
LLVRFGSIVVEPSILAVTSSVADVVAVVDAASVVVERPTHFTVADNLEEDTCQALLGVVRIVDKRWWYS